MILRVWMVGTYVDKHQPLPCAHQVECRCAQKRTGCRRDYACKPHINPPKNIWEGRGICSRPNKFSFVCLGDSSSSSSQSRSLRCTSSSRLRSRCSTYCLHAPLVLLRRREMPTDCHLHVYSVWGTASSSLEQHRVAARTCTLSGVLHDGYLYFDDIRLFPPAAHLSSAPKLYWD